MTRPAAPARPLAVLARFLPYLWPQNNAAIRRRVVFAVVFLLLQKAVGAVVPLVYGRAVDIAAQTAFVLAALLATAGAYAAARLLQQVFEELKFYVFARVAQQAMRNLALHVFSHLHNLSMRFHLNRQTGGLSRVLERGVKSVEFLLTFFLFNVATTAVEIALVCGIFAWIFDWRYPAVAFVSIVVYSVFTVWVTEWRVAFRRRMNEADKHANTRAVDSLLNYETVKIFNAEAAEARRYDESLRKYEEAAVANRKTLSLLNIGQGVVVAIGMFAIMGMAAADVAAGNVSVGLFAASNMYLLQLYLPLGFLGTVYREIRQALTDMEEMFGLMAQTPEVQDAAGAPPLCPAGGRVEFCDVFFAYDKARGDALRGVSFVAAAGQKTAIVGASGSGKSTILRLLCRFYDPRAGKILMDGQDIRICAQDSVRAAVGVVPQDTVLFNDSIRNNLLYANPNASEAQLRAATAAADIAEFIAALPRGEQTQVGERGLKLSGGEKQRLAIARALLKNPAILLFDEATSALDTAAERRIQAALPAIAASRALIVVAHRLSTIVDADNIVVLEDGRIVERGKHADLLAAGGVYAALWRQQAREKK